MTSEQLQHARAERWRQTSNPLLTSEDATAWIDSIGLCLYFPRHAHFRTPAPSFVEAIAGAPTEAPARASTESAASLLHSLTAESQVVPLNLFGEAGGGSSDQPDFLVTRSTLPFVFSMVGGRNWKSGPGAKASPLMQEIWALLEKDAPLTAAEIQTALGRELTEAAVLRALVELWRGLRVIPVYDGDTTRWELTQARFAAEMTASQKIAQTTALSLLVALYLESTLAASTEEIETFLSPLAPRSRVREVVNGLQATRQIALLSIGAQPLLHVPGSLPEFPEEAPSSADQAPAEPISEQPRRTRTYDRAPERKPYDRERKPSYGERKPFDRERKPFDRERKPFQRNDRFAKRGEDGKPARESFRDKPYERRREERPDFRARRSEERPERGEKRGEKRFGNERKFGGERKFGEKKFGEKRFGGEKKFGEKRFQDRGEYRPRDEQRGERPRREERGAPGGERREKRLFFKDRGPKFQGERPRRFEGERSERPRRFEGERSERPRRFEGERSERPRRFEGERPPFPKREGGWKKDAERPGQKFFKRDKPGFQRKGKPDFERKGKPDFEREGKPKFSREGKPRFEKNDRKPFGKSGQKPYAKSGKPFGKSSRPFGKGKPGKPAFGARKPGGFKPPFRKRKSEGGENAE